MGHFVSARRAPEVLHLNGPEDSREERYANAFGRAFLTPARVVREKFQEITSLESGAAECVWVSVQTIRYLGLAPLHANQCEVTSTAACLLHDFGFKGLVKVAGHEISIVFIFYHDESLSGISRCECFDCRI